MQVRRVGELGYGSVRRLRRVGRLIGGVGDWLGRGDGWNARGVQDRGDGHPLRHLIRFGHIAEQDVAGLYVALQVGEGVGAVGLSAAADLVNHERSLNILE